MSAFGQHSPGFGAKTSRPKKIKQGGEMDVKRSERTDSRGAIDRGPSRLGRGQKTDSVEVAAIGFMS